MNISNHCKMQFLKRTEGAYIINDNTFKTWSNANQERVLLAEKEIQEIFKTRDYIIKGDYGSDNAKGEVEYSICWNDKLIFISNKDNIITVYPLSYSGLGEGASEKIFKVLIEELDKAKKEYEQNQFIYDDYKQKYEDIVSSYKVEQAYINSLQDGLKAKRELLDSEYKARSAELNIKKSNMQLLEQKIVKPIQI